MVKKSLQQPIVDVDGQLLTSQDDIRPLPKEGDIVLCSDKWESDEILGNIRSLRESFYKNESTYIAEIIPLKEGKSENIYVIDRSARSISSPITKLKPVKFFYVRSENGYRIQLQPNSSKFSLRASSYRKLDPGVKLPSKAVNLITLEEDMIDYSILKNRLLSYTFQIGAIGTIIVSVLFGIQLGADYFLGVSASIAYLYLLGETADSVGETYSKRENKETKSNALKTAAKGRLLVPALLIGIIAVSNQLFGVKTIQPFSFVSKEQYLSAIGGFLTYRISLFISEVAPEVKFDDIIGILPGSIAEGYRQLRGLSDNQKKSLIKQPKVFFISGPRAAGREYIANNILDKSIKSIKRWKYFTTDWKLSQLDPIKYDYIDELSLKDLKNGKSIIFEGYDSKFIDSKIYLSKLSLENGKTYLLEGPPQIIRNLYGDKSLECVSMWLTAQSKEQFISGAKKISAYDVNDLLEEAAKDIIFYKDTASQFDHTLVSGWWEDSVDYYEVEKILTSVN